MSQSSVKYSAAARKQLYAERPVLELGFPPPLHRCTIQDYRGIVIKGAARMIQSSLRLSAFLSAVCCLPLLAHHGTSNYATTAQTVTLSGTVTEFVWSNPHVYVLFDVKDATGNVVHWAGEM